MPNLRRSHDIRVPPCDARLTVLASIEEPVTAVIFQARPFGVASVPSAAMIGWAVAILA